MRDVDLVVIGAGHAGCEAALAAARLGLSTALVTIDLSGVGRMPCNPALGGPGKSQLVREVDALGGEMALLADRTALNARLLNTSKGPAMQVRRVQTDRIAYASLWKERLEATDGVHLLEGMATEILVSDGAVRGVRLREGIDLRARAVVLATGTFLNGRVLLGTAVYPAGRSGEPPAVELSAFLRGLGLRMGRLNTGTTPRVHRRSIDVTRLIRQETSGIPLAFSFWNEPVVLAPDFPVYVTRTNEETHRIVRESLHLSPNYNGLIAGEGPRHCPSFEAKVVKFPERASHKVFLEPESRSSAEVYLQGIYTALPPDVQDRIVRSIQGLEEAEIERYGYDIEYDYVDPTQLSPSLEVKGIGGLFLAGQINGTTGYEEAAAQGLLAGINAARGVRGEEPVVLSRGEAVIGVLIDDLVNRGVTEPYRMLPSRAEYRLTLREGNADLRLAELGHRIGLLPNERLEKVRAKRRAIDAVLSELRGRRAGPGDPLNRLLAERGTTVLSQNGASLEDLLRRPELHVEDLVSGVNPEVALEAEIEVKYEGYLAQQAREIGRLKRMERIQIPEMLDYRALTSLSIEARELLDRVRPRSFGQATRIPGLSQADLALLAVYLRR
jgi:tRNA uridine 5-carboxymethylaminomethyl modification enzyme